MATLEATGYVWLDSQHSSSYATCADGSNLSLLTGDPVEVGAQYNVSQARFEAYELFFEFDLSAVPAGSTLDTASLSFDVNTDQSQTDFVVTLAEHDWGPSVTTADWQNRAALTAKTTLATAATATDAAGNVEMVEAATPLATALEASFGSTLKCVMFSDRTAAGTAPSFSSNQKEFLKLDTGVGKGVYLTYTYTEASSSDEDQVHTLQLGAVF